MHQIRTPELRVIIDESREVGVLDARIVSTNYYSADWFHITLALADPRSPTLDYWSSCSKCLVDIQSRTEKSGSFQSMILGYVDSVSVDPIYRTVRLEGRDLSATLIDTYSQGTFTNQSASEIVSSIAVRGGLIPNVHETKAPTGRFYGASSEELQLGRYSGNLTDWDMVVSLAQRAGYDAYVMGRTLHFQPPTYGVAPPKALTLDQVTELHVERSFPRVADRGISVKSWHSVLNQSLIGGLSGLAGLSGSAGGFGVQQFAQVIMAPNSRPMDLDDVSERIRRDMEQHELTLELDMPGELTLSARSRILLTGVSFRFDRAYDVESIDRAFSSIGGFLQKVRARQALDYDKAADRAGLSGR